MASLLASANRGALVASCIRENLPPVPKRPPPFPGDAPDQPDGDAAAGGTRLPPSTGAPRDDHALLQLEVLPTAATKVPAAPDLRRPFHFEAVVRSRLQKVQAKSQQAIRDDRNREAARMADQADDAAERGDHGELYAVVRRFAFFTPKAIPGVLLANGDSAQMQDGREARWREHFSELLLGAQVDMDASTHGPHAAKKRIPGAHLPSAELGGGGVVGLAGRHRCLRPSWRKGGPDIG